MSWPFSNVTPCGRRDRPVPIPSPGIQLVNLSHVEDLAEMMAAVPGNAAAVRQHFNLASDRAITFDGMLLLSRSFPSLSPLAKLFSRQRVHRAAHFKLASDHAITFGGMPPLFLTKTFHHFGIPELSASFRVHCVAALQPASNPSINFDGTSVSILYPSLLLFRCCFLSPPFMAAHPPRGSASMRPLTARLPGRCAASHLSKGPALACHQFGDVVTDGAENYIMLPLWLH